MNLTESFTFNFYINGEKKSLEVHGDNNIAWAISIVQASTLQIPSTKNYQNPLWLLVNNNKLINSDTTSLYLYQDAQFISIQYALTQKYFKMIYDAYTRFGVLCSIENAGLLVFSMHIWIQNSFSQDEIKNKIYFLIQHYSILVFQPQSIYKVYLYICKNFNNFNIEFEKSMISHSSKVKRNI